MMLAAKPGDGALDSRWPGILAADLSVAGLPSSASPNAQLNVEVAAENTGDTVWLHRSMRYGGYIRLGIQLLSADGAMLTPDFAAVHLPADVRPRERIAWNVPLRAPDGPGRYVLRFDLVDEFITWFQDRGSRPCDRVLVVE